MPALVNYLLIIVLAVLCLNKPGFAQSFSCKEANYSFSNTSIILEINKNSKFKEPHRLEKYLRQKFRRTSLKIERIFEEEGDTNLALKQELGLDQIYRVEILDAKANISECAKLKKLNQELKQDSNFNEVSLDYVFEKSQVSNDFFYSTNGNYWSIKSLDELYSIKNQNIDEIWDISTGAGVVVAVIDTGVDYNHPDLWANIWVNPKAVSDYNGDGKIDLNDVDINANQIIDKSEIKRNFIGKDFAENDFDPKDNADGHGTHMAGIIAATRNNYIGITGIAPDAQIMAIKALDDNGRGKFSNLAKAVVYASDMGADVINSSWGCQCETPKMLLKAYRYANRLGVVNVAAAGNYATLASLHTPSNLTETISVTALDYKNDLASFANYGDAVDIAAPGYNLLSTLAHGTLYRENPSTRMFYDTNYDYYYQSGTSVSTAYISGVIALILSKNPDLNTSSIKSLLKQNADSLTGQKFGRINVSRIFANF